MLDLTPLYVKEVPILLLFLDYVLSADDGPQSEQSWDALVEKFGKIKSLNLKTGAFTAHTYSCVTRLE